MLKKNLGNLIKSVNLFEIIWLISTIVLLGVFIGFFPDIMFDDKTNLLVVVCSVISIISSPICEMLISKQSRYWTIFSLFFVEITDIVMLFSLDLYSSALISLFFWIPFDLITFFKWGGRNIDDEKQEITKVKSFNLKQSILVVFLMVVSGLSLGFVLSYMPNTDISYTIAFSNVFEICNGIFLLTRHNEQWFAWFGYLICEIIIWISIGHYVMLITVFAMMVNTIYGFIKWLLYIKHKKVQKGI